jgi:hypothetical protein
VGWAVLSIALSSAWQLISLLAVLACALIMFEELRSVSRLIDKLRKPSEEVQPEDFQVTGAKAVVLQDRINQQHGNVVVYSGFVPFVGSGTLLGEWSFAINVTEAKCTQFGPKLEPTAFRVGELYHDVSERFGRLGLRNAQIEDQVYVNGRDVQKTQLLPNWYECPTTNLPDDNIRELIDNPSDLVRHYRVIRITGWDGELIVSVFFRFSRYGDNLFVEASKYLLPPLKEGYHAVDSQKGPEDSFEHNAGAFLVSVILAPFLTLAAIPRLLGHALENRRARQEKERVEKEIENDLCYNYGALSSLRESEASGEYRRYFQVLDRQMYVKVMEKELLHSIIEFLDAHNIDTSEIKERESAILNTGVIVSQSSIQGDNVALGNRVTAAMQSAGISAPTQGAPGSTRPMPAGK